MSTWKKVNKRQVLNYWTMEMSSAVEGRFADKFSFFIFINYFTWKFQVRTIICMIEHLYRKNWKENLIKRHFLNKRWICRKWSGILVWLRVYFQSNGVLLVVFQSFDGICHPTFLNNRRLLRQDLAILSQLHRNVAFSMSSFQKQWDQYAKHLILDWDNHLLQPKSPRWRCISIWQLSFVRYNNEPVLWLYKAHSNVLLAKESFVNDNLQNEKCYSYKLEHVPSGGINGSVVV